MEYVNNQKISLKKHSVLSEKWVQELIAKDPSILGLGDLIVRDIERRQPRAGRLDLLLQDPETDRRYEVELQLGKTDETHIIRTIEYWDIERKRYPQYDHCAVIVAEDVTSRFLNVISLFNGSIPIIAIQMNALEIEGKVTLVFTTVLDEMERGLDEDIGVELEADREYWRVRVGEKTLSLADGLLQIVKTFEPNMTLKYNKDYIGLQSNGKSNNYIIFGPKKRFIRFEPRIPKSEEMDRIIEEAGFDSMNRKKSGSRYRLNIYEDDLESKKDAIVELVKRAYDEKNG